MSEKSTKKTKNINTKSPKQRKLKTASSFADVASRVTNLSLNQEEREETPQKEDIGTTVETETKNIAETEEIAEAKTEEKQAEQTQIKKEEEHKGDTLTMNETITSVKETEEKTVFERKNETEEKNTPKNNNEFTSLLKGKKRIEDTHERRTFMIDKKSLKRLDNLAKKVNTVGFKTKFINMLIEEGLNRLENELEQDK